MDGHTHTPSKMKCVRNPFLVTGQAVVCALTLALLWMGSASNLFAQATTGTITGIVVDQSEAVIPGASVVLTDEGSGALRRTVTNDSGLFTFVAIPAATYKVTIERQGFARWERTGVKVYPGDRINVPDIVLPVAGVAAEVKVEATPDVIVPVDSGEKAHVITAKQIQNLSIIGRGAEELLRILPGVVYGNPDRPGEPAGLVVQFNRGIGDYNVSGGRREGAVGNISDGADVIDPGCECGSAVTPNVDMVQEVKVQTSNFAAEYSKGPVVFNSVSKSGASDFHGEAYMYLRHHSLNSQDWRNNFFGEEKGRDSYYFPGFNIGGPLSKGREKVFFFAGVEFMRQNVFQGVRPAVVPNAAMKAGDFSDFDYIRSLNGTEVSLIPGYDGEPGTDNANWGGPALTPEMISGGVISPDAIDPGGQIMMNLYPTANQDPATAGGFNYTSNLVVPQHRNQQLLRLDFNVSDNTKIYTRFNHEGQDTRYPFTLWWNNSNDVPYPGDLRGEYTTWSSSTSLVNVLNPTTTNEVVFAATYWDMPHRYNNPAAVSRSALGYPYGGVFGNPTDNVPNMTTWAGSGVADFIQPGGLLDPTIFGNKWLISVADNFSKVKGTHMFKFGAYFQYVTNDEPTTADDHGILSPAWWGNNSSGNAYADLLLGRVGDYGEATTNVVGNFRKREWAFYAQDSWKATRRLTVEYGARFQHLGWMYEKNGFMFGFDPNQYDPSLPIESNTGLVSPHLGFGVPRSIWETPALTVAPRLGFAFDVTGRGDTVIRGGAGVYKYHGRHGDIFGTIGNPPLRQSTNLTGGLLLKDIENMDPAVLKSNLTVVELDNDKQPTTYTWSFTLSHRLPSQTVFEASYVGNGSTHQVTCANCDANDLNAVPEGAMLGAPTGADPNDFRPFQNYGRINVRAHSLSQNYHALQVTANRQTGRVNYTASYTWGKALGTGGDSFGVAVDSFDRRGRSYGPLPYDRTHSFSVAYNIYLPDGTRHPGLGHLLNGWQVSGITQWQSGAPIGYGTLGGQPGISFNGTGASGVGFDGGLTGGASITGSPNVPTRPFLVCDPRPFEDNRFINPSCFRAPEPGLNGHYVLPYLRHPAFQVHDLSLFKNFQLSQTNESRKLQFRFSMYNFVNHPLRFFEGTDPGLALTFENGVPNQQSLDQFGFTSFKRGRRLMQIALKFFF